MNRVSSHALFDKYVTMGAYHWRECDRRSPNYNPPLVARYEMVLSRVPHGRVLDVGAGDGYLTGRLAERCREVVGLEYEPSGVELARAMLVDRPNATVEQGDAYRIPFADGAFDAVVMADVIEHLDRPSDAVAEIARVLTAQGVALVTTPHWRPDRTWDVRHVKEFTAEELKLLLSKHFDSVDLVFAWPRIWSDLYRTRVGWRLLRLLGRAGVNPFRAESEDPEGFCQILAICRARRGAKRG